MKIGVLGLGFMGSTHLKAYKNIPEVQLTAVASDIPQALTGDLSHIQGNIGGPGEKYDFSSIATYSDPFEAVRDPNVDAIDICLPTNLHAPVALAALRAGKHVLVEKPMALTGEDCDGLLDAAAQSGRILMSAQVVRFLPAYAAAAKLIKSGELGPVRSAMFRRRCAAPPWSIWLDKKNLSGGGIFDLLVHDLDFCIHLFGFPEAVSAVGYEDLPHGLDWITAELFYPEIGGVVVSGGWHHPKAFPFSADYTVLADGGTIEYSGSAPAPTLYKASGEAQPLTVPEKDGYQAEIEYFVDCCLHGKQPDFCPPRESAAAVKLGRLVDQARDKKGEKLECSF
ncbi:MAG TPA: Gfo/Idh/MocA family oxidoreductase [Bryobacteraceae bacterium]